MSEFLNFVKLKHERKKFSKIFCDILKIRKYLTLNEGSVCSCHKHHTRNTATERLTWANVVCVHKLNHTLLLFSLHLTHFFSVYLLQNFLCLEETKRSLCLTWLLFRNLSCHDVWESHSCIVCCISRFSRQNGVIVLTFRWKFIFSYLNFSCQNSFIWRLVASKRFYQNIVSCYFSPQNSCTPLFK